MQLIFYKSIKDPYTRSFIAIFDTSNKLRSGARRTSAIEDFLNHTIIFFDDDNVQYDKITTSGN